MIKRNYAGKVSILTVLVLLGVLVIATNNNELSQADNLSEKTELTGADYEEIKALYARYNLGSDFRYT